jgi:hypothetical protein
MKLALCLVNVIWHLCANFLPVDCVEQTIATDTSSEEFGIDHGQTQPLDHLTELFFGLIGINNENFAQLLP